MVLGAIPYEERLVARATPFEFFSGLSLRTCSAEDLVTLKAFADRPRDWDDIEGIVSRQVRLDWDRIESELLPLAEGKDSPEILDRLAEHHTAVFRTDRQGLITVLTDGKKLSVDAYDW